MSTVITFTGGTIKKGTPFPQGQTQRNKYDPSRGFTTFADYDGYSQEYLQNLYQSFVSQGIGCELELYLDKGRLRVEDATQEYTIDSWEIVGNESSVDGLSHPTVFAIINAYQNGTGAPNGTTSDVYGELRQNLANDATTDDAFTNGDQLLLPYSGTLVEFAYSLNQRGSTDFRQGAYVLRHTTNVSNRWQANVSDFGVDSIYTPAQLLTEVTDSGLWIFPLPGRLQYKIAFIPSPAPQPDYLWGWLKSASTETTAANNRVNIQTEYTLALWANAIDVNGNQIYYSQFSGVTPGNPYY